MTKGGPGYSTHTVSYYLFANAFEYGKMGYACAMAVVMFVIILTVTLIQDKVMNKNVQYDS
jgi:ABC-type sugar transport system permease subunit